MSGLYITILNIQILEFDIFLAGFTCVPLQLQRARGRRAQSSMIPVFLGSDFTIIES